LPFGRRIELPRRGTTFVREMPGPPGAPTVLLLHGWIASSGLNWYQVFQPLGRYFNVVAPDLRGHSRGLRSRRVFRLADCADDCAATLIELGIDNAIVVGYSMGGPVAQLAWRRHRDLVSGLVLCATSAGFFPDRRMRTLYQAGMLSAAAAARVGAISRFIPTTLPAVRIATQTLPGWAAAEMQRHDWRLITEAGQSLTTYHAHWIGDVDVPTAIVCTTEDMGVRPSLQLAMADAIRGATVHRVADGHLACANTSIVAPLIAACCDVAGRVR
jgi:pimeloyl-ACP methyl ester carboxylesterase